MALKFADVAKTLDWCGWLKTHYIGNIFTWGVYAAISQGAPHSIFGIALLCFGAFLGSLFSLHICFGESKLFSFLSGCNFWKGYNRKIVKRPMTFQVSCPHGGFAGIPGHPDTDNAPVTNQESPTTPALASPMC